MAPGAMNSTAVGAPLGSSEQPLRGMAHRDKAHPMAAADLKAMYPNAPMKPAPPRDQNPSISGMA